MGKVRKRTAALSYGEYKELILTNMQYAFARNYNGQSVIVTVNNADNDSTLTVPAGTATEYIGSLSGTKASVNNGCICVNVKANSGEIWIPVGATEVDFEPISMEITTPEVAAEPEAPIAPDPVPHSEAVVEPESVIEAEISPAPAESVTEAKPVQNKSYEEMTIEELQEAILERMRRNGPVTDQMRKDVIENVYHNSLVTWIRSFN